MPKSIGKELLHDVKLDELKALAAEAKGESLDNGVVASQELSMIVNFAKNKVVSEEGKEENDLVAMAGEARAVAASLAALAAVDGGSVLEQQQAELKKVDYHRTSGIIPRTPDVQLAGESFTSASPSEISQFTLDANLAMSRQNEFAETIFPTIVQPVGKVIFKAEVHAPHTVQQFVRDGSPQKNSPFRPVVYDLNDLSGIFGTEGNRIYPVVGIKSEFDNYLDVDVKKSVKDPASGSTIETAPIKLGVKVPLIDISQSPAELANGVADMNTTLAPGAQVTALHAAVDDGDGNTERYAIDTSAIRDAKFYGTPNGDTVTDIQMLASTRVILDIADLKKEDGSAGTAFQDGAGALFVYDVRLSGTGSTVEKDIVVDVNEFKLVSILRNGKEVPTTASDYDTLKAAGDKLTKSAFLSATLKAYITNENMRRAGIQVTTLAKSEEYVMAPMAPITVRTPVKGIAGKYSDAGLVDSMGKMVLLAVNLDAVSTVVNAANTAKSLTVDGTIVPETKIGIGSYICKPTYVPASLDLTNAVNSIESSKKDDDIVGAIISVAKNVIAKMMSQSGLADYRELNGLSQDLVFAVGSDIAAYLPKTIKIENYNIRVVSTRVAQYRGRMLILPGNFSSDRNRIPDYSSFGAYLYTPVLIGDYPGNGVMNYVAQPNGIHAVFNYVVGDITITGIDTFVAHKTVMLSRMV